MKRRVIVDASALAAVIFEEPGFEQITRRLAGAVIFAPTLLKFELAGAAWKKAKRHPSDAARFLQRLAIGLENRFGIVWKDVNVTDVALVALATGLSVYDASYLWLAGDLGADLVTLDKRLAGALDTVAG